MSDLKPEEVEPFLAVARDGFVVVTGVGFGLTMTAEATRDSADALRLAAAEALRQRG